MICSHPSNILVINLDLSPIQTILFLVGILVLISAPFIVYIFMVKRLRALANKKVLKEKVILEQLFNNIPDRIYFKDRESRFILANKFVSRIMGENDPANLIGKTDFDFYDDEFARPYYEDEQRIMKEGKPMIAKEEKGLDEEGKEIFVSTTKIPIRDHNNRVIGIVGIGRDISKLKEVEADLKQKSENLHETNVLLEERQEEIEQMAEELNVQAENLKHANTQLERLSLVASKTENTVVIMDSNGNFEWVNAGFEQRYGLKMDEFINQYGKNLRENSSYSSISAVLNQIYITQKPYTYNSKFVDSQGNESWNQTNITPIMNANDEIVNLILIDSDITELKLAEERIRKQNTEIASKSRELKKINATKDRLFSIIAHDLKNPFHSILGFTEILQNKYKDIDPDKLGDMIGMIGDSSKSAYQLLENLLEWARTQTDNVKFSPSIINLQQIINEVIHLLSLQVSKKELQIINDVDSNLEVYADRNMLNTVIRNLTNNAIKYTESGGQIHFKAAPNNGDIQIQISDTGIGMSPEKLNQLFHLDKVESTAGTEGETGTGLGLIVCYEFIQKNGGTIVGDSTPGEGSTFKITLPATK